MNTTDNKDWLDEVLDTLRVRKRRSKPVAFVADRIYYRIVGKAKVKEAINQHIKENYVLKEDWLDSVRKQHKFHKEEVVKVRIDENQRHLDSVANAITESDDPLEYYTDPIAFQNRIEELSKGKDKV